MNWRFLEAFFVSVFNKFEFKKGVQLFKVTYRSNCKWNANFSKIWRKWSESTSLASWIILSRTDWAGWVESTRLYSNFVYIKKNRKKNDFIFIIYIQICSNIRSILTGCKYSDILNIPTVGLYCTSVIQASKWTHWAMMLS